MTLGLTPTAIALPFPTLAILPTALYLWADICCNNKCHHFSGDSDSCLVGGDRLCADSAHHTTTLPTTTCHFFLMVPFCHAISLTLPGRRCAVCWQHSAGGGSGLPPTTLPRRAALCRLTFPHTQPPHCLLDCLILLVVSGCGRTTGWPAQPGLWFLTLPCYHHHSPACCLPASRLLPSHPLPPPACSSCSCTVT